MVTPLQLAADRTCVTDPAHIAHVLADFTTPFDSAVSTAPTCVTASCFTTCLLTVAPPRSPAYCLLTAVTD